MPLSKIQQHILRLLAAHRDPESYVAGATPLNRDALRYSDDIDIFHDRQERVAAAAVDDMKALRDAGYRVTVLRQLASIYTAEITGKDASTHLEWLADSDFRFFPTIRDEELGYALHPVDLAMNKAMAAAGRREVRDLVDLLFIHQTILPLGAVVWAAIEKSPGFTPEGLIAEIRRNSQYPASEWHAMATSKPIDPKITVTQLRSALDEAEAFVLRMPTDKAGLLFLEGADVVQPDPDRLHDYQTHVGRRRGHWPTNSAITAEMFERLVAEKRLRSKNEP